MSVALAWGVEIPAELDADSLLRAAEAALLHGGRGEAEIELAVVSDGALAELHGRYLDDDSPTDVLGPTITGPTSRADAATVAV